MPVTRIAIREGKTPEYKQALMDEIYEAMRETVAIKDGDRFMAITEHGEHEFAPDSPTSPCIWPRATPAPPSTTASWH